MPPSIFQILYKIAYEEMGSEEGASRIQAEQIEDELEGAMP